LAKSWGLALGAVQFLPTWEMLHDSVRAAAGAEFLASGSLHPANLVQLVAPYLFRGRVLGGNTHEMGLYLGAAPLCLAVAGWATAPKHGRGRIILAACAAGAILSILAAVGRYSPLFALQRMLPFRCPCRAVVLFQFSAAIAAAYGFQRLLRFSRRTGSKRPAEIRPFLRVVFAIAAASIAAAALRVSVAAPAALPWAEPAAAVSGALLFSAAALTIAAAAHGYPFGMVGLILLTAGDLATYGLSYAVWPETQPFDVWRSRAAAPPLSDPQDPSWSGRVVFLPHSPAPPSPFPALGRPAVGNECLLKGLRRMDGYAGLPPRRVLDMGSPTARRIADVSWAGRFQPSSLGYAAVAWEKSPDRLPRFRTVGRVVVASPTPAVIERLDPQRAALVEKAVGVSPEAAARLGVLDDRPGRMAVAVQASGPLLLVVSEAYHSGWGAAVDGRESEVLRVNGDFMGCVVPPGRHRVILAFRPWSLIWGRGISFAALTLSAGAFLLSLHVPSLHVPRGRGRKPKTLD
ncbi:MAG: YfhO family protein, partial [Thermogutta sp.]|nr:YfhO family protein [Thermogutta sp.]